MSEVVPLAPGRRAAAIALVIAVVVAPLLAAFEPASGASTRVPTSLVLQSQTTDVVGQGTFSLGLHVTAPLPPSDLAIEITLFSRLSNRTYFEYSLSGSELPSESCLSETAALALTGLSGPTTDGSVRIALPVSDSVQTPRCGASGSGLALGCAPGTCAAGVYPVQVALVDPSEGRTLEQFTTHLIELQGSTVEHRLQVALVLTLGGSAALAPSGESALDSSAVRSLAQEIDVLAAHHGVRLTVAAYAQLLDALAESGARGTRVLHNLDNFIRGHWKSHTVEPIGTPYAPLDASALASAHLGTTLTDLLRLGQSTLTADFGRSPALDPYVAPASLDGAGNGLLSGQCVHELLLPPGTVTSTPNGLTQTAPLLVSPSAPCPSQPGAASYTVAFAADSSSSLLDADDADAVLRAHQFIASLAQIYFEQPNAAPRAVVIEPAGVLNPTLLSTVLSGLSDAPFLQSSTLGALFSTVAVGAANSGRSLTLPDTTAATNSLPTKAIANADHSLRELTSLVPSNRALAATLAQSVELGETTAVSPRRRADYLDAPANELDRLGATLSFLGSRSVTLTAQSGDIPITLHQGGGEGPMAVAVRLLSSELVIPKATVSVGAFQSNTQVQGARVETHGSGNSPLFVEVLTPFGGRLLLRGTFTVQSRAISGVSVGLSVAALAVLAGWWLRSLRSRRRARRATATS